VTHGCARQLKIKTFRFIMAEFIPQHFSSLSFTAKDVECRLPKLRPASPFCLALAHFAPVFVTVISPLAKLSLRYLILKGATRSLL